MNNSQIKYPYIGEAKLTRAKVLFFTAGCGTVLDGETCEIGNYNERFSMPAFIDITHDFLQNTYGEVISPEHAEFIIELAKNAGFGVSRRTARSMCFEFSGDCNVVFYEIPVDIFANNKESKKITIPLPPKTPETLSPDEETELKSRAMASELNSQSNDDEWPKVGEKVICNGVEYYYICKSPFGDEAVLSVYDSDEWDVLSVFYSELKKPKTPEDLLIEELQTKLVKNNAVDNWMLAANIISGDIEGLTYNSKDGK